MPPRPQAGTHPESSQFCASAKPDEVGFSSTWTLFFLVNQGKEGGPRDGAGEGSQALTGGRGAARPQPGSRHQAAAGTAHPTQSADDPGGLARPPLGDY